MKLTRRIVDALQRDKDFVPYNEAEDLLERVSPPAIQHAFLGVRSYWGSLISLAVIRGEMVHEVDVPGQAETYYRFVQALQPFADSLQVRHGGLNAGQVKLGSFGLMCYVFESGCSDQMAETIRTCRHGSLKNKDYVRCWVLDGHARRVIAHRWVPFGMFPGKRYLRSLL